MFDNAKPLHPDPRNAADAPGGDPRDGDRTWAGGPETGGARPAAGDPRQASASSAYGPPAWAPPAADGPPPSGAYRARIHVVPGLPEAEDVFYAPPPGHPAPQPGVPGPGAFPPGAGAPRPGSGAPGSAGPSTPGAPGHRPSAPGAGTGTGAGAGTGAGTGAGAPRTGPGAPASGGPATSHVSWAVGAEALVPAVGHTPPPAPTGGHPAVTPDGHPAARVNGHRHPAADAGFTVPPTASVSAAGVGAISRRPPAHTPATTAPPGHAGAGAAPDPALVRILKERAAEQLHEADKRTPGMTEADREQRGRAIVAQVVAEWADIAARERGVSTSPAEDRALARAVWDWLFRAGPLEPYLTDPAVENILVNGYDTVWVDYADRPRVQVPPLTASDDELRELLRDLARRHGSGERTLSTSQPTLALRLPDGSRLQAITEVTPHTYVTIRRHRVRDVRLADLVGLGTLDRTLAAFLGSLVRARKNMIICGTQGVGKTSLLRALSHEIPADERIGTFETELELFLHELGHLRQVVPIEAREGNGERGADGKSAGELTIGELIPSALRMSLSRMIVGEVRSSEIVPMLRVMTNGEGGSMCTLHVREPDMIFDRIAELCLEYGAHMSPELAYRLASNAVDYVVFVRMIDETAIGGRRHRFVSHVLEVTGMGEHRRPAINTIFAPTADDPRGIVRMYPSDMPDLMRAGFSPHLLDEPHGWRPLHLKLRQVG